jgi:carbon-monoxide dehydrogenase small subunit
MWLSFILNGKEVTVDVSPTENLVDVLRAKLGVTSVKKGCETGDCGACSVLLDGELVNSCIVLAPTVEGKCVTTVEGLMVNGELDSIQKALAEHHGTQCGFCTPGMVLAIKALLNKNPKPTEAEIRRAISGNLCRCTGYQKIVDAVKSITA